MIPNSTKELYGMLVNTPELHSLPQFNNEEIIWPLYQNVYVRAYIEDKDTYIGIVDNALIKGAYTHWHPDNEEIYNDLCALGKHGNILVLRQASLLTEIFYQGPAEEYRFSPKKKWH